MPTESYQGYPSEGYVETSPSDGVVYNDSGQVYSNDGYVDGGTYVEGEYAGDCANGNCSGHAGGGGSGRLHYMIHGGEEGRNIPKQYAQPDLFYNYYSNGRNQVNAEMYLSPTPVPPFVGNTWYTYQPFMPHNYLYQHTDRYHNHYDHGRGTNRTKATYRTSARQYAETFYNFLRLPR